MSHGGICCSSWEFERERYSGLEERAYNLLRDIITVANNLGFECDDSPKNYEWVSRRKHELKLSNGETLVAVRAYQNGNMHFQFNPKVMLAINVESGRLLGWIRNPHDACEEMGIPEKEASQVQNIFGSSFRITPDAGLKIGYKGSVCSSAS